MGLGSCIMALTVGTPLDVVLNAMFATCQAFSRGSARPSSYTSSIEHFASASERILVQHLQWDTANAEIAAQGPNSTGGSG